MQNNENKNKKMYKVFSPWLRLFHWTMVGCVLTLFVTGLYIGDPGFSSWSGADPTHHVTSVFSMSMIRKIHFIAAGLLIASVIMRIYGAIIWRGDRLLPKFWKKKYWEGLAYSTKHYLFFPGEERFYLRNSLARTAYTTIYIALFIIIVTGLSMASMVNPDWWLYKIFAPVSHVIPEYFVHIIHHVAAWYFIIFMILHVYLAFRADYVEKDGELSAMVSGYKFFEEEPYDIEDLDMSKDRKAKAKAQAQAKKNLKEAAQAEKAAAPAEKQVEAEA